MNQSLSYFNTLQSNSRSKESLASPIQTSTGPKIKSLSFSRNLALYGTMGSFMAQQHFNSSKICLLTPNLTEKLKLATPDPDDDDPDASCRLAPWS